MSARRNVLVAIVLLLSIAAAVEDWDFLQLGRQIPELVPAADRADLIRVDKTARTLSLLRGGDIIGVYKISLGTDSKEHKIKEGDGRTPEGRYVIDSKNNHSRFHLSLHVSYPNAGDRERALRLGVSPGGDIMVHGLPNGLSWLGKLHLRRDWTDGCIAVTNPEIDDIWARVAPGTAIEIRP